MITAMLVSFAMIAQAQISIGGELGFTSTGSKFVPKTGDVVKGDKNSTFTFSPMVAYQFSEKLALGARIGFERDTETRFKFSGNDDRKNTITEFNLGVFIQYTCLEFGKFSVLTEAGLTFGTANEKRKIGSNTDDLWKGSGINIGVTPILAYDLNEKIRLTCQLNFLSLGYTSVGIREPANSYDKEVIHGFNFGINTNNVAGIGMDLTNIGGGDIARRSHFITIGFLYKL